MHQGHDSATSGRIPTDPRRAPDDLEVLRGFINTEGRYHGNDQLRDPTPRPRISTRLLPDHDVDAVDVRGRARLARLRDALRALLAGADGADDELNRVASRVPVRVVTEHVDGRLVARLAAREPGPEHDLATAVLSALQVAVHDGRIGRLRLCERPECGWCYYDSTRNRSGRWCSSDPCGDVMKTRALRARQRTAG